MTARPDDELVALPEPTPVVVERGESLAESPILWTIVVGVVLAGAGIALGIVLQSEAQLGPADGFVPVRL